MKIQNIAFIALSIFIIMSSSSASPYSLTTSVIDKFDKNKIFYSHNWSKVKKLSQDVKEALGLNFNDNKSKVLSARFIFYVKGRSKKFNQNFYLKIKTLDDLSGMNHKRIGTHKFMVEETSMSFKVKAEVELKFNIDYYKYQRAFDYMDGSCEGSIVHQSAKKYNKLLKSSDIITHVSQEGDYVKVLINSYAVLPKKGASRYLSFAFKKIMVKRMKEQMLKVPLIYESY